MFLDPVPSRDNPASGFDSASAAEGDLLLFCRPREDEDPIAPYDLRIGVDVGRLDDEVERYAVLNQELRR
jgi:hypothetical protein